MATYILQGQGFVLLPGSPGLSSAPFRSVQPLAAIADGFISEEHAVRLRTGPAEDRSEEVNLGKLSVGVPVPTPVAVMAINDLQEEPEEDSPSFWGRIGGAFKSVGRFSGIGIGIGIR